jgi:hypothetical protein
MELERTLSARLRRRSSSAGGVWPRGSTRRIRATASVPEAASRMRI